MNTTQDQTPVAAPTGSRERPILFSGEMVRAILEGRKTQTRRIVKPQPEPPKAIYEEKHCFAKAIQDFWGFEWVANVGSEFIVRNRSTATHKCPYGHPGDRLWVRETWAYVPVTAYRCSEGVQQSVNPSDLDMAAVYASGWDHSRPGRWRPSIHMPRWASRITLEIEAVRVERLKDISNEECFAEGLPADSEKGNRTWYGDLWESINGKGSWDLNPRVWVIQFKRVNERAMP